MNIAVLPQPGFFGARPFASSTPARSRAWRPNLSNLFDWTSVDDSEAVGDTLMRLAVAHTKINRAISQRYRYFGAGLSDQLRHSFKALLDPEEFEGVIPNLSEVITLLRVIQLVQRTGVCLGMSEIGVLSATWTDADTTLYIEALEGNKIRGVQVAEGDDQITTIEIPEINLQELFGILGL